MSLASYTCPVKSFFHKSTIKELLTSMFDKAIKTEDLQDFKASLHGELICPGDDSYESARRVWNGMHVHGAVCRVEATETTFALREKHYALHLTAAWEEGEASPHIAWLRDCWAALEPFATSEAFLNFMDDTGEARGLVQTAYGANYKRLVALKNRYDPGNFFQFNQNIKPQEPVRDSMSRK